MNTIKNSYPNGQCPDCGEEIPDDVVDEQSCENCGHVFFEERGNDGYITLEECEEDKTHLTSCDNDGFCNFCGEQ